MGTSTFRDMPPERQMPAKGPAPPGKPPASRPPFDQPPSTYWRRRFIVLVIGLAGLALVAWAFKGVVGGASPSGSPAATRSVSGDLPSSSPTPSIQSPTSAPTHAAAPAAKPTDHKTATGRPTHHATTASRTSSQSCPAGSVVLSLFSSQVNYTPRQTPEFQVDVVSTATRPCYFDIGSKHVVLQISAGNKVIWTSAVCAEGEASVVTKLQRGVPTVVSIGWDGRHSTPGCPGPGAAAAAGPYAAVAADGSLSSNPIAFRIS